MKKLNKQLTVYLSKSLLIPDREIQPVREILTGLGFKVTEYCKEDVYNEKLVSNADFVVFLTKEKQKLIVSGTYNTFVGRGQYDEAIRCSKLQIPAFMIHQMKTDDPLISKLTGDSYKAMNHILVDTNDWKSKYGSIVSYVMGMSIVPLFPMLQGLFGLHDIDLTVVTKPFGFTVPNNRLLLLLK